MLFAVTFIALYVGSGVGHLLLLVSVIDPFHLCAFYPSGVQASKVGRRDFAGAATTR